MKRILICTAMFLVMVTVLRGGTGITGKTGLSGKAKITNAASPVVFADNCTRSDADSLGTPWTAVTATWGIRSNRCVNLVATNHYNPVWVNVALNADQYAVTKFSSWNSVAWTGPTVRYIDGVNLGYRAACVVASGGNCVRVDVFKGTSDVASISGISLAPGGSLGIAAAGTTTTTVTVYWNGTEIGLWRDLSSPYTSGFVALESYTTSSADNGGITYFEAGNGVPPTS